MKKIISGHSADASCNKGEYKINKTCVIGNKFATSFPSGDNDDLETVAVLPDPYNIPVDRDCRFVDENLFCTHAHNYPDKEYLTQLLEKDYPNMAEFFDVPIYSEDTGYRTGGDYPGEESLCKSRVKKLFPEKALNKDLEWLFIVNLPNYRQSVRIEECTGVGHLCGLESGMNLPNRYTSSCEQAYVYQSMVAYKNKSTNSMTKDNFLVPSCCRCVVKSV